MVAFFCCVSQLKEKSETVFSCLLPNRQSVVIFCVFNSNSGSEAMLADLGNFSQLSQGKLTWSCFLSSSAVNMALLRDEIVDQT